MFLRKALFVIVVASVCLGCHSSGWTPGERLDVLKVGAANIEVYDAAEFELGVFKEALGGMTPVVQSSIVSVSILTDDSHFKKLPVLASTNWDRRISLLKSKYQNNRERLLRTFWHESGHCGAMLVNKTTDGVFKKKWMQVAGPVYYNDYNKILIIWFIPQKGLVCFEAEVNFDEDVACFYDAVMQYEALKDGRITYTPFHLEDMDSSDGRYIGKLNLLLEYGFITQRQYDLVAPLCR